MKITLSVIKADIGAIGGHITPSKALLETVEQFVRKNGEGLLLDYEISHTGDDIAILSTHQKGPDDEEIHKLCWDAFMAGTETAKSEGLYGAGQDLLADSFSGNVKGAGPASAEIEFEERPNEPFLFFAADKTEPGAFNLPLYLAFADPMWAPGLLLSTGIGKGFTFTIMDVDHTDGDRVIELHTPEDLYEIACLLRDNNRFVVDTIASRDTGEQCTAVSTSRLHNIAGKYTGKDDPVCLVRVQKTFPATGEVLSPYQVAHYVGGFTRGSHYGPLMPVKRNSTISFFDGPPIVSCTAYCVHDGKLTEPADAFDHPFWDEIRSQAARKAQEIRRQGFSGNAMVGIKELEYGGIKERLARLNDRFVVRED